MYVCMYVCNYFVKCTLEEMFQPLLYMTNGFTIECV